MPTDSLLFDNERVKAELTTTPHDEIFLVLQWKEERLYADGDVDDVDQQCTGCIESDVQFDRVLVDLKKVKSLTYAALNIFIDLNRASNAKIGRKISLCNFQPGIVGDLMLINANKTMDVYGKREQALDSTTSTEK